MSALFVGCLTGMIIKYLLSLLDVWLVWSLNVCSVCWMSDPGRNYKSFRGREKTRRRCRPDGPRPPARSPGWWRVLRAWRARGRSRGDTSTGWRATSSRPMIEPMRIRWEHLDVKLGMIETMRIRWEHPDVKLGMIETMRIRWEHPDVKLGMIETMRIRWGNPGVKPGMIETMRTRCVNPGVKPANDRAYENWLTWLIPKINTSNIVNRQKCRL